MSKWSDIYPTTHMQKAETLARKVQALLSLGESKRDRGFALMELEDALEAYQESLQWEIVRLHEVFK